MNVSFFAQSHGNGQTDRIWPFAGVTVDKVGQVGQVGQVG
jgi:hypothetical protein